MVEPAGNEDEKALLREWARGSHAAGEALLRLLLPGIYGLCLRILRRPADAEEASQETFLRLCSEVRNQRGLEEVRKWAATVAMNLCIDKRRQRAREIPVEPETEAGSSADPLDQADLETVRECIAELPERYRLVLHHCFAMNLKPREIADVMGLEDGAARVLLHRALAALRKKVKE